VHRPPRSSHVSRKTIAGHMPSDPLGAPEKDAITCSGRGLGRVDRRFRDASVSRRTGFTRLRSRRRIAMGFADVTARRRARGGLSPSTGQHGVPATVSVEWNMTSNRIDAVCRLVEHDVRRGIGIEMLDQCDVQQFIRIVTSTRYDSVSMKSKRDVMFRRTDSDSTSATSCRSRQHTSKWMLAVASI
jgi:hypothetical protein